MTQGQVMIKKNRRMSMKEKNMDGEKLSQTDDYLLNAFFRG